MPGYWDLCQPANSFHKSQPWIDEVYLLAFQKARPSWEGTSTAYSKNMISSLEQHWEMRSLRRANPESRRVWSRAGSYTAAYQPSLEAPNYEHEARSHFSHLMVRETRATVQPLPCFPEAQGQPEQVPLSSTDTDSFPVGWKCLNGILQSSESQCFRSLSSQETPRNTGVQRERALQAS